MQITKPTRRRGATAALLALFTLCAGTDAAQAAVFTKNNTAGDLSVGTSWTSGTVPGGADVALFNNTVTAAQTDTITATALTLGEIQLVNPGGAITINGPSGLTLNGVNGVGIDMSAATQNLTIGAPLTLGGSQAWNVAAGRTLTINGTTGFSQGANTLTLNGFGTVNFQPTTGTAASTATGAVVINAGTLQVYANTTSPTYAGVNNILSGSTPLTLGGGSIAISQGSSVGTFTQNFASTTIAAGASTSAETRGSSSTVVLNFGAISRNVGGTVNFGGAATNNSGYVFGNGSNGIVGGFATYGGTDFIQFVSSANVDKSTSFAPVYTADTWGGTTNTNVTLATNTQTAATTNSLRFAAAASDTITLSGVNVITSGGVLVSSAVTAGNADVITGGTLEGAAGADLVVNQFGAGTLAINSVIADNTSPTALTKTGTGTLFLGGANTFTGGIFINQGTIQLTSGGSLNGNALTFDNNSSGIVTLAGNSTSVGTISTSTVLATTLPQIQNASATAATLTINANTNGTFAGTILNGTGGGALGLTLTGTGVQTLTGTNTYTGPTAVNGGTLAVTKTIASSTAISVGSAGTLDVSALANGLVIASGNTLSGSGTVLGTAVIGSGANLTPGTLGTVGTLTLSGLTLSSANAALNFDLNTGSNDMVAVTGTNGLTINGGQFNLSGTATAAVGSTFNLFSYSGTIQGTGVSSLTVASGGAAGLIYAFNNDTTNHLVTLTISGGGALPNYYVPDANGAYGTSANWSAGSPPNAVGAFAAFGGSGSTALTANRTVTVDGSYTVGILALNSTTGFGYTLANGGTGTGLILNNGTSAASLTDTAGTHAIAAPLTMTANGATFNVSAAADTLTVSGVVSSDASADLGLTKSGNGTLALTGVNTYFGGTTLNGGTIQINSASSLGDLSGALTFGGGTLQLLADVTTPRNYQVTGAGNAVINTNGHTLTLNGTLAPVSTSTGGLVKQGAGTLVLTGTNTFTGASTINGGIVNINADAALGAVPAAAATNLTFDPGTGNTATLQASAALTLNANRSIVINSGTGSFDTNGNNVTVAGAISGNGAFQKDGLGTLTLTGNATQAGNATINAGTLVLGTGSALNGTIFMANATTFQAQSGGNGNNITLSGLNANATILTNSASNGYGGLFTGTADQTITIAGTNQVSIGAATTKQFQTFLGTVEVPLNTTIRFSATNLNNGGDNTTFDINGFVTTRNNGAVALGALSGSGNLTSGISPNTTTNSTVIYTIGAKGINSAFSGVISNANTAQNDLTAIVKTGAGTQTLSGANTYSGTTTVSAGTLQIGNGGTTGTFGGGTIANNATVVYNRSDATTVANVFSGTGTLVTLGGGMTTFTNEVDQSTVNPRFGTMIIDPTTAGLAVNSFNGNIGPTAGDNATVTVQNNGSYNTTSSNLIVGGLGTGTLNVNGPTGTVTGATGGVVTLASGMTIGSGATGVGTVNLNTGGTINTPSIIGGSGSSTFNFNGGTLVAASGANGTFMSGLTAARVQAGGAIINNPNTFDPNNPTTITITQALVHDPALGATADGGLTKLGGGMLTLSAVNTFNGGITITGGTLAITVNGALSVGNVTIGSGATLTLATGVFQAHNGVNTTTLTLADTTSVLNLASTTVGAVQDVVGSIVANGVTYNTPGYYGSAASGVPSAYQVPGFTGNGVIGVGVPSAVPEPSTWVMMLAGIGALGLLAARRRQRA